MQNLSAVSRPTLSPIAVFPGGVPQCPCVSRVRQEKDRQEDRAHAVPQGRVCADRMWRWTWDVRPLVGLL